jgi:hypothetical protein
MIATSDRGTLWQARLVHDAGGRLTGFADWQAFEPARIPGDPADADAEALAADGADGLVIAYEGAHRLRRFALGAGDPRFGGLSGIWLAPDGSRMIATSDRGTLWQARLVHDAGGRLTGFADWQAFEPGRIPGDPADADAEALAADGAGGLVIAYEGAHRLRRFALAELSAPPVALPALPGLERPSNVGVEALTALPDGALLALAEGTLAANGDLAAWLVAVERALPLSYAANEGFVPTGADRLDDTIFLVERRFSLLGGLATRIVTLPLVQIHPGARLEPRPLAVLRPPLVAENFEAIGARRAPDGRVLLYLLADDNFTPLLRTLMLQLSLPAAQVRLIETPRSTGSALPVTKLDASVPR